MIAPRLTRTTPAPRVGQVHLGPGAFFRAFNAVYSDEAMAMSGGDWGIIAVSLRSPTARDQMQPQDGVFTSVTLGAEDRTRVIGAVAQVMVAPEDPGAVVDIMADPKIRIVSLTITEKGYCHDPATGRLQEDHPDIRHDLAHQTSPRSAIGLIVAALRRRREAGHKPFTVLSCDNLPANGPLARGVVLSFARALDPNLASWIEDCVPFPATMVDRITPATTEADVSRLAASHGYQDPACVLHEGFRQWVIEDQFVDGRPRWEAAGAQFVDNVEAHELMKLRCLNGTHSTLAYLGYLAGYETIAETVADPDFAALCEMMWRDDITPTIPPPEDEDLATYCASLMRRFRNPAIRHRTWQIAMDGSQKLPQRLLGPIADNLAKGRVPLGLCLAVAAWMRYVGGTDETGNPIDVRDPMAARLRAATSVSDFLAIREIFPVELAADTRFRNAVSAAYAALERDGARATVRALVEARP